MKFLESFSSRNLIRVIFINFDKVSFRENLIINLDRVALQTSLEENCYIYKLFETLVKFHLEKNLIINLDRVALQTSLEENSSNSLRSDSNDYLYT
jgi:hypothetical protein